MLKQEVCKFEIVLLYEDEMGKTGQMRKGFSLKPTKEFIDWTESSSQTN